MPGTGREPDGRVVLSFSPQEAEALRQLPLRLRKVLERPECHRRVADRLFPPAYRESSREEEYRRLAGEDIVRSKLEGLRDFEASLERVKTSKRRVEVILEARELDLWLRVVNDMRLVLGTDLDVNDDFWEQPFDVEHPRAPDIALLHYLSLLEEELVRAGGPGGDAPGPGGTGS